MADSPDLSTLSERKSVLVALFGPSFSSKPESPAAETSAPETKAVGPKKSVLETMFGPSFAPAAAPPATFQPGLVSPESTVSGGSHSDFPLDAVGSICRCETCRFLKSLEGKSPSAETLSINALDLDMATLPLARSLPVEETPCVGGVELLALSKNSSDDVAIEYSVPFGGDRDTGFGPHSLIPWPGDSHGETSPQAASGVDIILGDRITDEMPVKDIVSSLEEECLEAIDLRESIPVKQRLGYLQKGMRILSKKLVARPEELQHPAPIPNLSPIKERLQEMPEKIGSNDSISKKEFESFRNSVEETLRSIHNFQMQVHQRVVPRIVLCSEGKGPKQKLVQKLAPGVKSYRLHMLCEQAGEEHKVKDAPGCDLHLKKGESWDAIYPFLYHGLTVFTAVSNLAARAVGVGEMMPSFSWLKEFNSSIVQLKENAKIHESKTPQEAAAEAASQGAEQWLVNHLHGTDKMQDFGLQRMVFEKSSGSQPKGSIVWLCTEHAERGKDSEFLRSLPTAAN